MIDAPNMTIKEAFEAGINFIFAHTEYYSKEYKEGAIKLNPEDHYWLTIEPAGELLKGSAEHKELRRKAWLHFSHFQSATHKK